MTVQPGKMCICPILGSVCRNDFYRQIIPVVSMKGVTFPGRILRYSIAVLQRNKMIIRFLCILTTSRIAKRPVCFSRNRGARRRRLSFFSSGRCDAPDFPWICFRHVPVKMNTGKLSRSPGFTGSASVQPKCCQTAVFFFCRINFRLILNLSGFLILFLLRYRNKNRCRVPVTERLIIMISMFYCFLCFSIRIRHHS